MKWLDWIPDSIWPHLSGESEPEPQEASINISDASLLAATEEAIAKRLIEAEDRFRTVEAKLMPLLALTSIVATAIAASVPFALSGQFDDLHLGEFVPILILGIYILWQVLVSLGATISALRRRDYRSLAAAALDPGTDESAVTYRLRLLNIQRTNLWWNEWQTNQKVGNMAVAYEALQYAVRGSAALVVAAIAIVVVRVI